MQRWLASSLAVLALALALATLLASWRISSALDAGKPKGTQFQGVPVSLFQYSKESRLHFFLSPNQIKNLSLDFAGSAEVVAASGVRALSWTSSGAELPIQVDFVSENFFSVLGIQFSEGSAAQFSNTADSIVLSQRFLQATGLGRAPATIRISGRVLQVVGVVSEFSGLFDRDSHAWINWNQASGLLYPPARSGASNVLDDRLWFFWTLAIATPGQQSRFNTLLAGMVQRGAYVEPPFSGLVALPGITNQTDLRADADKSQTLYLTMSWLLLVIATLAIGLFIALIRLSRLPSEWIMLRLGAGPAPFFLIGLTYVALPVLLSGILAVVFAGIFQRLLLLDPSVSALMAWSAELEPDGLWREFALIMLVIVLFCVAFNMLVMRGAGAHFGAVVLRASLGFLDTLFLLFNSLIAAAAALTLLIGVLAAHESWSNGRKIAGAGTKNVWFQTLSAKTDAQPISRTARAQLQAVLRLNPNIRKTGFATITPLSGAKIALSDYTIGTHAFKLMVNLASSDALAALALPLQAGRTFTEGSENEIVLDEDAAQQMQAKIFPKPVLGAELRDELGGSVVVVGIVGRVGYASDASQAPPMGYISLPHDFAPLRLIIQGQLNASDLRKLEELDSATIKFAELESFAGIAARLYERFQARSTITFATSLCALLVAVFLLSCTAVLRARRRAREHAIRLSLGAQPSTIILQFLKKDAASNMIGAAVGICTVVVFDIPSKMHLSCVTAVQINAGCLVFFGFCATTMAVLFFAARSTLTCVSLTARLSSGEG